MNNSTLITGLIRAKRTPHVLLANGDNFRIIKSTKAKDADYYSLDFKGVFNPSTVTLNMISEALKY